MFTDVKDPMAGFFATSRKRLCDLRSDIPGFKIGLELLAVGGDDLRAIEIPIVFRDRFFGFSKMNRNVILAYCRQLAQLIGIRGGTYSVSSLAMLVTIGILADILLFIIGVRADYKPVVAHGAGLLLSSFLISFGVIYIWRGTEQKSRMTGYQILGNIVAVVSSIVFQAAVL